MEADILGAAEKAKKTKQATIEGYIPEITAQAPTTGTSMKAVMEADTLEATP